MRRIGWTLVLFLLAATAPVASASHPTMMCLDIEPEWKMAFINDDIADPIWAYPGMTDANHPPQDDGCVTEFSSGQDQDWSGTNVDFEITETVDPDKSDSPSTPDLSCTVADGEGGCFVLPPESWYGRQTIRGWIDSDLNDTTSEADVSEEVDESATPGDILEPDTTDVARLQWSHYEPEPPPPCEFNDAGECPVETHVGIWHRPRFNGFSGLVSSAYDPCDRERRVVVRRILRGEDRVVKKTTSEIYGSWRVEDVRDRRGRYYAVAKAMEIPIPDREPPGRYKCLKGRSETIRVD